MVSTYAYIVIGCVVLLAFVIVKINNWIEEKNETKKNELIHHIRQEVNNNSNQLSDLKSELANKENVKKLLCLIKSLGADTKEIDGNYKIKNIYQLSYEIDKRRNMISELENEICVIEKQAKIKEAYSILRKKALYIFAAVVLIIIPAILYFIAVNSWKKSVEEFVYQLVNDNITKYSSQDDSDFYESKLEKYYDITEINYYKLDNVIEIVPVLKLYANNRYVDKDEGSVVLRELCDSYYSYTNKIPEEICKFGGTHIVANGTIIEPNGSKVFVDRYAKEVKYFIVPAKSKKFTPYLYLIMPYIIYCVVLFLICRKNIRSVDSK